MKNHDNYITHIKNSEDVIYLKNKHFPVNMRLFNTSPEYKAIILQQCNYIRELCLDTKQGYKKPHGMSSANAGLAFNIIGITINRNTSKETCLIMINPEIMEYSKEKVISSSNCGSLTLKENINIERSEKVLVRWKSPEGKHGERWFNREQGSLTIQHEIDHNLGILITDRIN
jgi:peptide deformylase